MSYLATSYFYCVPKGLQLALHNGNSLNVMVGNKKTKLKAKPFITSMLISILGLTFRFRIYLRVRGLGYKAYVINSGKTLNLKLGLSHTVTFNFIGQMHALKLGQKERMFSIETDN
jgi:ribosomal protein L6P/L9E